MRITGIVRVHSLAFFPVLYLTLILTWEEAEVLLHFTLNLSRFARLAESGNNVT